ASLSRASSRPIRWATSVASEPFFAGQAGRNGTEFIITSEVSKAWPIPDGGLGAVSYMFEVLMGVMGDRRRWRTMPWMVLLFGIVPPLADSDHLIGALVITVAVIAMAEVGRALRFINVLFGLWLIAAPWLLAGGTMPAAWAEVAVGLILIALSLPRGQRTREH